MPRGVRQPLRPSWEIEQEREEAKDRWIVEAKSLFKQVGAMALQKKFPKIPNLLEPLVIKTTRGPMTVVAIMTVERPRSFYEVPRPEISADVFGFTPGHPDVLVYAIVGKEIFSVLQSYDWRLLYDGLNRSSGGPKGWVIDTSRYTEEQWRLLGPRGFLEVLQTIISKLQELPE